MNKTAISQRSSMAKRMAEAPQHSPPMVIILGKEPADWEVALAAELWAAEVHAVLFVSVTPQNEVIAGLETGCCAYNPATGAG